LSSFSYHHLKGCDSTNGYSSKGKTNEIKAKSTN
jgi:hypothetical protein